MTPRPAVVLGGGDCVWDDVAELGKQWPQWMQHSVILSVNDIPCLWPARIDHWCTLHPERFPLWVARRKERRYPLGWTSWSPVKRASVQELYRGWSNGSSGLYAVSVALLALRCSPVILCGVPMQPTKHVLRGYPWNQYYRYMKGWTLNRKAMTGRVFSFSGWTRETFGYPRLEALKEHVP